MNLALWIIAIVLAVAFAGSGLLNLVRSKEQLVASGFGWAEDFSTSTIRLIGVAEVLGAIGLILPATVHIAPILVPVAAVGLALVMAGAAVVHGRRKEAPMVAINAVLLALAVVVAWGRFGPYPLT
jgi:DoxX-like family